MDAIGVLVGPERHAERRTGLGTCSLPGGGSGPVLGHPGPGQSGADGSSCAELAPLVLASPDVTVELVIEAAGGIAGIPRETLNLVVLEGLRQLGLRDIEVVAPGEE